MFGKKDIVENSGDDPDPITSGREIMSLKALGSQLAEISSCMQLATDYGTLSDLIGEAHSCLQAINVLFQLDLGYLHYKYKGQGEDEDED